MSVNEAIRSLVDVMSRPQPYRAPGPAEGPEWLFEEGFGRIVVSRRLHGFSFSRAPDAGRLHRIVAGIDGSSRVLYFAHGNVALAATTLLYGSAGAQIYYTYPPLRPFNTSREKPVLDAPFLAFQPAPLDAPEVLGGVRLRPPSYRRTGVGEFLRDALYRYDAEYSTKMMENEVRVLQENAMVAWALQRLGPGSLLVVDGPIFSTPGIFERMRELLGEKPSRLRVYLESWLALVAERVRVVDDAVRRGVDVVGVVKRLHASRVLAAAQEQGQAVNDLALVQQVVEKWMSGSKPYTPMLLGPLETSMDLDEVGLGRLAKYSYYVVVPRHPLASRLGEFRVFRVEMPRPVFEDEERRARVLSTLVAEASRSPDHYPRPISAADRVCRRAAAALAAHVYMSLSGYSIPGYETLREAEERSFGRREA